MNQDYIDGRLVVVLESRPGAVEAAATAAYEYGEVHGRAPALVSIDPICGPSGLEGEYLLMEAMRRADAAREFGNGEVGIGYAHGVKSIRSMLPGTRRCFHVTAIAAMDRHGLVNARFQTSIDPEDYEKLEPGYAEMVTNAKAKRSSDPSEYVDAVTRCLLDKMVPEFEPVSPAWVRVN